MIAGVIGGCACGMISWLSYASQFPGGLAPEHFVKNTGQEFPMLLGNCVAITFGAIFSILVSFCTRPHMTAEEVEAEWEITRNIDNPLSPWVQVYKVLDSSLMNNYLREHIIESRLTCNSLISSLGRAES